MKIAAIILVAVVTHWMAFMVGRADVMQNTVVMDVMDGIEKTGIGHSYFGTCAPGGRLCATDADSQKPHWIPRGL